MLTIGVWAIVLILLIAFWERVAPAIGGLFQIAFVIVFGLILLSVLGYGVYWILHQVNSITVNAHDAGEISAGLFMFAFIIAGIVSIPHVLMHGYKIGARGFLNKVRPKAWGRILAILVFGVYGVYFWNLTGRYLHTTAVDSRASIWTDADVSVIALALGLMIYFHRRLCIADTPSCWITRPFKRKPILKK